MLPSIYFAPLSQNTLLLSLFSGSTGVAALSIPVGSGVQVIEHGLTSAA